MSDELDPFLLDLFEAKRTTLNDPEFVAALLADIDRQQRAAARWRLLVGIAFLALLAWQLPGLLRGTATMVQSLSAQSQAYTSPMISPLGWALSMIVGLLVMLRIMPRRL